MKLMLVLADEDQLERNTPDEFVSHLDSAHSIRMDLFRKRQRVC